MSKESSKDSRQDFETNPARVGMKKALWKRLQNDCPHVFKDEITRSRVLADLAKARWQTSPPAGFNIPASKGDRFVFLEYLNLPLCFCLRLVGKSWKCCDYWSLETRFRRTSQKPWEAAYPEPARIGFTNHARERLDERLDFHGWSYTILADKLMAILSSQVAMTRPPRQARLRHQENTCYIAIKSAGQSICFVLGYSSTGDYSVITTVTY